MEYETYEVIEEDTLIGISLRFDMPYSLLSLYTLLTLNHLSESTHLVPGMILKICKKINSLDSSIQLESKPLELLESLEMPPKLTRVRKQDVFYCTREGDIKGTISITPHLITFDPEVIDHHNCEYDTAKGKVKTTAIQFQACIDFSDIVSCQLIDLPYLFDDIDRKVHFLQIGISNNGKERKHHRDKVLRYTVYFKVRSIFSYLQSLIQNNLMRSAILPFKI